jgi:hypothetical protein
MARTPEGKVKSAIDAVLNSYGARVWYFKPATGGYGRSGVADYMGIANGYGFMFEAKRDDKHEATPLQIEEIDKFRAAGGPAFVIHKHNLEYVKIIIDYLLEQPPGPYNKWTA